MKKRTLLIILILIVLGMVAGIVYWCLQPSLSVAQISKEDETNKVAHVQPEQVANPLLVRKWYIEHHPTSFKVYYDDPCDQPGYFWGKEWNEEENIYEEDLLYHGNGWFQWCKQDNQLLEMHMMDNSFVVPIEYEISSLTEQQLVIKQGERIKTYFSVSSLKE